jgi:hypothetical protein
MTKQRLDGDERLDRMRAEFRDAQQRRYEKTGRVVREVRVLEPTRAPEDGLPTLAIPSE